MGYRYGRPDINGITLGISICNMGYRYGRWYIAMVIYHIDMVILDIDMALLSSPISIWDILSLCSTRAP